MTKEDEVPKCKLRFKGVENFLRRVAFNLGNTPSQTEVKIISCIPIDVSDLQQKIVQLEKQLEDSRKAKEDKKDEAEMNGRETTEADSQKPANGAQKPPNESSKQTSIVQTAIYTNVLPRFSRPANRTDNFDCSISDNTKFFDYSSSKQGKSATSFIFSATPATNGINSSSQSKQSKLINGGDYSTVTKGIRRKIFGKTKRLPNKRMNSQLVYYTETNGTPFLSHDITHTVKGIGYAESDIISRSYLFNMMRKQYKSNKVIDELSNTSYFTSPICKDGEQEFQRHYETDTCSCCHGTFQNIDDYLSKTRFNTYSVLDFKENDNRNTYYDSSLYDLIPVKEKPVKNRKEFDTPNRKEPKIDIKCWPENVRVKSRPKPNIMDYQTIIHDKNVCTRKPITKINNRKVNNTVVSIKLTKDANKLDQQTGMESSENCFIDLGNLNKKHTRKLKTIKLTEKAIPLVKNVECLTSTINHSECQSSTLNPITKASENKTEDTLNQIKCILQSVLTEIKTTSQVKRNQEDTKKDAIVQNEVSQNNIHDRSSLLNSFTYSPYNINPYGQSCSKPMLSNFFCYPRLPHPVNCMQNYPLIIQGTERHLCTGCFRSSHIKTHKNIATTAGTNTEKFRQHRNNETEKLIKEIYKSIALDIPTKDTSLSKCDERRSITATTGSSNCSKENKQVRVVISELFTNKNVQMESSRTNDTNSTIHSKILKADSTQSRVTSTDTGTDNQITDENTTHLFTNRSVQQTTETEPETEKEIKPLHTEPKRKPPSTVSDSSESEESSETENVVAAISPKETRVKKKTGIFCKMFQIFNKTKKSNNIKNDNEPEESDTSDSNDYQTIYSYKSEIPQHDKTINRKSGPHSKILLSRRLRHRRRSPEKARPTPYMEQEYRRLWNEKLIFYGQKQRYSSEEPFRTEIETGMRHNHPYYQNYEARAALVDPGILCHHRFNQQNRNALYTNAADNFVNRSRFEQQLNPIPYTSNDAKCKIQDNARFTVPMSAFNRNGYQKTSPTFVNTKQEQFNAPKTSRNKTEVNPTKPKGMQWLKKHKMGIRCGQQWKQLLLES